MLFSPNLQAGYVSTLSHNLPVRPALRQSDSEQIPNEIKDRFRLCGRIGVGGAFIVLEVEGNQDANKYALKVPHAHLKLNEEFNERWAESTHLSQYLRGKHFIKFIEAGSKENFYVVNEFVDGPNLLDVLTQTKNGIHPRAVVKIGIQVCRALEELEKLGLVHRDIKPANLLLSATGIIKVIDFNLINDGSAADNDCRPGTPLYMSPEIIRSERTDVRSDLYSLGCSLYEMLTKRAPLIGRQIKDTFLLHLTRPPEPPSFWRKRISPELDRVILTALEKKPEDRFQSASDMRQALREILKSGL